MKKDEVWFLSYPNFCNSANRRKRSFKKLSEVIIVTQCITSHHIVTKNKIFPHPLIIGKKPDLPDATGTNSETQTSVTKGLANYLQRWTGYQ